MTVAISVTGLAFFGLDFVTKLGIGSALGVLTTVLIANSLLIAVLAKLGHKIDRLKVPFLRRSTTPRRPVSGRSIARWGRFVTAHAKAVFSSSWSRSSALAATSAPRPPRRVRPGHPAQGADRPPRLRPARRGLRRRLQRPDPDRRRRERRRGGARSRSTTACRTCRASRRPASRSSTTRRRSRSSSSPRLGAAGRGDRRARRPPPQRRRAGRDRGQRRGRVRLRLRPRRSRTSPSGSWSGCRSSCSTSSGSRSSCSRWRSGRS